LDGISGGSGREEKILMKVEGKGISIKFETHEFHFSLDPAKIGGDETVSGTVYYLPEGAQWFSKPVVFPSDKELRINKFMQGIFGTK
jgi:hypothetical protein